MSKRSRRPIERFPAPPGLVPTMPEYDEAQALRRGLLDAPEAARDRLRAASATDIAEMLARLILLSDLVADRDDPRRGRSFAPLLELRRAVQAQYVEASLAAQSTAMTHPLSRSAARQLIDDYLAVLRFSQADALLQQLEATFTDDGAAQRWGVALRGTRAMRQGVAEATLRLGIHDPLVLLD